MEPMSVKLYPVLALSLFGAGLWPFSAAGQGLSENVTEISGAASVLTSMTHTRIDRGTTTDSSSEPSLGISGNVGGQLQSGANSLALQYGGTFETERDLGDGEQTESSSVVGLSRFSHFDPGSRFDFNLGHTVSSVRNDTGFVVNPSDYDTQNTLNAGAGIRFYPGDLSTLRFSGEAGKSFGSGDLNNRESFTAASEFFRRLSQRSSGGINVSKSWSNDEDIDITIDSAQLVYSNLLENGSFRIGAGGSQADTEYPDGLVTESEAVTGFLGRTWLAPDWETSVEYNRRLSDSATDLSLELPADIEFIPDTIRIRDLVVSDSILISHNTSRVCSACNLGLAAEAALLESENTGSTTHEYFAEIDLDYQLTSLQRLALAYRWQGDAGEDAGTVIDQIHRFNISWIRQLAEEISFSVEFDQAYLRSRLARSDEEQFVLRLRLSKGFSLVGQPR
ncbi:hypothetical protein [Marinobacter salsuginis]|uniref:Uncharacterized protein n=1 Tax=Marinobacter salsuginis TaxID=418719 RepID=A0A5M3Q4S2_9GAMM|nr:hypothetical protein [Marinobacter salsuginis]GBO90137.1 hypothetical protein MSSD14B_38050 [Marinobacter salsuginis]